MYVLYIQGCFNITWSLEFISEKSVYTQVLYPQTHKSQVVKRAYKFIRILHKIV